MFSSIASTALVGVETRPVQVEVHAAGSGKATFSIVGLPDTAVREARERVLSALHASQFRVPASRITVNLSPADLPKAGSAYDLPIALGTLVAMGQVDASAARVVALGELALNGTVRAVRGGLGAALVARRLSLPCVLAPGGSTLPAIDGEDAGKIQSIGARYSCGELSLEQAAERGATHIMLEPAHPDLEDGMTTIVTGTMYACPPPDEVFPPAGYP